MAQKVLREMNLFVHPFWEVLFRRMLPLRRILVNDLGKEEERAQSLPLSRQEKDFMKAQFSKWGMRVRKIARQRNSVLVIEPIYTSNAFISASVRRFCDFAEKELGKDRVFTLTPLTSDYAGAIDNFLKNGFVPAKKIHIISFGEWGEDCCKNCAQFFSRTVKRTLEVPCTFEVAKELSVSSGSFNAGFKPFRQAQRRQRKEFRRRQTKKQFY